MRMSSESSPLGRAVLRSLHSLVTSLLSERENHEQRPRCEVDDSVFLINIRDQQEESENQQTGRQKVVEGRNRRSAESGWIPGLGFWLQHVHLLKAYRVTEARALWRAAGTMDLQSIEAGELR